MDVRCGGRRGRNRRPKREGARRLELSAPLVIERTGFQRNHRLVAKDIGRQFPFPDVMVLESRPGAAADAERTRDKSAMPSTGFSGAGLLMRQRLEKSRDAGATYVPAYDRYSAALARLEGLGRSSRRSSRTSS